MPTYCYNINEEGSPPEMMPIHVAFITEFVKFIKHRLRTLNRSPSMYDLVDMWNADHSHLWNTGYNVRAGQKDTGKADHFFQNRYITLGTLFSIVQGELPLPVAVADLPRDGAAGS